MARIDEVLERLVTDPAFRARLAADPAGALAGYELAEADLELLTAALRADPGGLEPVEARNTKTAFAGLIVDSFAAVEHGLGAERGAAESDPADEDSPVVDAVAVGGRGLDHPASEPHPMDSALLSRVEQWCGWAAPDGPVDLDEVAEMLGIGSEQLARRVLAALPVAADGWAPHDVLQAMRQLVLGTVHDKLAFAFRLHDVDGDGFLRRSELVRLVTLGLSEDNAGAPPGESPRLADTWWKSAGKRAGGGMSFAEFEAAVARNPMLLELTTHTMVRWLAPNEDVLARLTHPRTRRMKLRRLLQNQRIAVLLLAAWSVANLALFVYAMHVYAEANQLVRVARGAGACLNFNGALILVPMMRRLLTRVRRTPVLRALPVDEAVDFHRLVGSTMFAFALVHTAAHVVNYAVAPGMTVAGQLLATAVGLSGLVLLVIFAVMWVFSRTRVRRSPRFGLFYATHTLYLAWFALALVHAPNFWIWASVPLAGFAVEQLLRRTRRLPGVEVVAGQALRSGVTRLAIRHPVGFRHHAGDYLFLRIPAVARHEWHPFTISSAPERNLLSVHVRALGDWTSALRRAVEQPAVEDRHPAHRSYLFAAHLDGPYGAPATHVFDSRHAVLVGAGIGVTPFASVLESIVARAHVPGAEPVRLRTVNFFWVNRDLYSFEWFAELLAALERVDQARLVRTHLFMTGQRGDPAAAHRQLSRRIAWVAGGPAGGLNFRLQLGHPDWAKELGDIGRRSAPEPVDVYFCGPPGLARVIKRACTELGLSFRQERF